MNARWFAALVSLTCGFLLFAPACEALCGTGGSAANPKTNLEQLQLLLGRIGSELISRTGIRMGDTVDFRIRAADDSWIAREALIAGLNEFGARVFTGPDSGRHGGYLFQVYSSDLHVQYEEPYHEGILGTMYVRRRVTAGITCEVSGAAGGVMYSGSPSYETYDTVAAGEIPSLEHPAAKATHAELPPERFLDRVLEPLVIIGATGISIFLFFHVRS